MTRGKARKYGRGEDVVGTAVAATAAGARLCLLVVIVRRLGG